MMRDILQVFNPNNKLITAKSVTCGKVELELIKLMNEDSPADCNYFFNSHRTETRSELKQLLAESFDTNKNFIDFHGYKVSVSLNVSDFESSNEASSLFVQNLATFLNVYNPDTIKAFTQCFRMVENRYGWHQFSLEHFLEFWQIAEIDNITNTQIGNRLRQWQNHSHRTHLAS